MQRVLAVLAAAVGSVALALTGAGAAQAAVDLDVLFVGAHPDDEAGGLSTYGAWAEEYGLRTGVITVTRGEGGGSAVGPEEGPPLGLLREAEERRAVGRAGIRNVYNLDKVDFYYTVSAPLTQEIWSERDALERVVRVVRATRPEVIVTMNPSPSPGNHGNHQQAARLAVEAYDRAADPSAYPAQLRRERLAPWRAGRLFRSGADAATEEEPTGPACARSFRPAEPTDQVFGVWSGARARNGKTWDQIEVEAEREYASQGWASFEDAPTEAAELECDFFTQLASRVPYTAPNPSRAGMAEGALRRARGGLPLGTELSVTAGRFDVAPGRRLRLTVHARAARRLGRARVRLALPRGWSGERTATLRLARNRDATATLRVRAPAAAVPEARRVRIGATLTAGARTGSSSAVVRLVPPVRGTLAPLPQVAEFRTWTRSGGLASLDGLVDPVATLGSGQRRSVRIELENRSTDVQSGTVALRLPPGFAADAPAKGYEGLAPGERDALSFEVANTDTTLKTSEEGGDYPLEIVTTTDGAASTETVALELVPTTSIPRAAAAPALDGAATPGEYTGPPLDLSRIWEGEDPPTASATARLTWAADALYAVVEVRDDVFGAILPVSDAKRHWRTDSMELAIDPGGASENTSTTFKAGVFPATAEGGPFAARDADNRQGPAPRTAPGLQVASRVTGPYGGYALELKLPFAELPAAVRPGAMGLNLFVYDSDTQDKTGQNRHGWSTWRGVQGDPYRWGRAVLEGFAAAPGAPAEPKEPVIPREVARSLASPQSIAQSARDDVGLAGGPRAARGLTLRGGARRSGDAVLVALQARERGTVHAYATDAAGRVLGSRVVRARRGRLGVRVAVPAGRAGDARRVAVALEAAAGGTDSATARVGH